MEIDGHKYDMHDGQGKKRVAGHGLKNSWWVPAGCAIIDLDDVLGWVKNFLDDSPGELLII